MRFHILILLIVVLSTVDVPADDRVDYQKQIKPVLRERCYACHGPLKQEGGLRLDTAALAVKGGENGAAIKPGDADASLLLQRVTAEEESERMPPEGEPLKPAEIAALQAWILQNATAPADEAPEEDPRDHWAFRTPVRPDVPQARSAIWNGNSIDGFIARGHEEHGLVPQMPADRRVWLRRISLDLIGLPPSPDELDAFVADESDEAYAKVVDRLLDSPQYGQRWGRHWMDIWRYSDWWGLGAEVRNSQKHIWHWRDWIIESLNSDKGYDQMLREMLAADELYPNDLDRLRATGYLARQYFIFNRTSWMDETIEHTAKGMLGLTFNCAKCHDHKYDPLSQAEYYKLRAVFEPYQIRAEMLPGETNFEKDAIPRVFDAHLDVPTYLHVRGDDRNPDKSRTMEPAVPAFLSSDDREFAIAPVSLPIEATYPGMRDFVIETHREAALKKITEAQASLDAAQKKCEESEAAVELKKTDETSGPGKPSEAASDVLLTEDFKTEKPNVWEQLTGKWRYENDRLIQSQTGSSRAAVRLKQMPPNDFEARLKYVPTGGEQWKSVGISCDVTADGNELLAYVSAYSGGPRSQFAYKKSGAYVYPPEAAQQRKVELNEPHEIVLRARGALFNLTVDGEHSFAYRLPTEVKRQRGFIELIAFDAEVEFLSFELRTLPPETKLVEAKLTNPAKTPGALSLAEARLNFTIAQRALQVANTNRDAIEARIEADMERRTADDKNDAKQTKDAEAKPAVKNERALSAAKAERILAAAQAEEAASRAELVLLKAAADKKPDAEKKLAAAKTALNKARTAVESDSDKYTPLPGSKKTQEDYQNRNAGKPYPRTSTGRRSAFAKWLTDPRHPLPARVAVNHIWARHMGKPLVPTVFDFGRKGTPPTHPELLDWLAVELIENGWSMKHIHRLIVLSQTYRMKSSSAAADESNFTGDRDNRFYWRMNPVRMEAQIVRDSLLQLAGELDLSLGGPSIPVNDQKSRRRSLYFVHSHNDHQKFLSMFDDANVLECYRRAESIVPQQALALENSSLVTDAAGQISQRIQSKNPAMSDDEFIRMAFITVLATEPTESELSLVAETLPRLTAAAQSKNRSDPQAAARVAVVHALLNHNDFVTAR